MSTRRSPEHQRRVIEARRSNATRPVPARKVRRQATRAGSRRAAVRTSREES